MADFKKLFERYANDTSLYNNLPILVRDMVSTTYSLRMCSNYNELALPLMKCMATYNDKNILDGLVWLQNNKINSFVFVENSTYALTLLYKIFRISEKSDICKSCSITEYFDLEMITQYNDIVQVYGVVIKMTAKRR